MVKSNKKKYIIRKKKLGLVCCREKNGRINILTDGDLRRHSNNLYKKTILKVCSKSPTWISDSATALSAIEKMNSLKITSLLVARNQDINKKIIIEPGRFLVADTGILVTKVLYKKTIDGKIRFSERPAAFKKQSLARVPPENYMVVEDE